MHDAKRRPAARRATPEKLKRDAENIRRYARFAIVLGESGIEVIDNGARRAQGLPYARIIAVLGPVQYGGESLPEGNLLEIGYSRTRPYAQMQSKNKNGNRSRRRWSLTSRSRVRPLSKEEVSRIYPHIVECMNAIVRESRENWKTQEAWYIKGYGEVERGIYFTVSHSDRHLHRQFILEDVRYRKNKYILGHATWIQWLFKEYKSSHHTVKRLKRFASARRIADMLSQGHYTPFYRAVLCRHFEDGSHERVLLDSIVKAFKIDISLAEQEVHALGSASISLPQLVNLRCYRIPRQPTVHAREATVFEIFLEREYRLALEERSHCGEKTDDEIPF